MFFLQSAATSEKPSVPLLVSLRLNLCHQNPEEHIPGRKVKAQADSSPVLVTWAIPGSKPARGLSEKSCWLPAGWLQVAWRQLTGCPYTATAGPIDTLAGLSGARSRAAICSLPRPSSPKQPDFFLLEAGAPCLCFVCTYECALRPSVIFCDVWVALGVTALAPSL